MRAQEKEKEMLRRGGAACEVIGSGSEIGGKEFGQTKGGNTVEYRVTQAASTENSRSVHEKSGIRTAGPRKCKRISQKSSEKEKGMLRRW